VGFASLNPEARDKYAARSLVFLDLTSDIDKKKLLILQDSKPARVCSREMALD
jgi:hypothetical protein